MWDLTVSVPDHCLSFYYISLHPAGDVTRVSVMPKKVTMKIGDAENRCR